MVCLATSQALQPPAGHDAISHSSETEHYDLSSNVSDKASENAAASEADVHENSAGIVTEMLPASAEVLEIDTHQARLAMLLCPGYCVLKRRLTFHELGKKTKTSAKLQ